MTTLLEPGQIPQASGEPPRVLTPDAKDVFAHRARRFVQLAEGHPLGDYLRFMSRLAQAQQQALDALPAVPVPDDEAKSQSSQHGMPLVPAQSWPRDPVWRAALSIILCEAAPAASETAAASIKAVGAIDDTALEGLAERVLRTELYGEHADKLPFVAAALQVYWTKLAVQLGAAAIAPLVCERSVLRLQGERAAKKQQHWQGVAIAAAEQCGRTRLPCVDAVTPFATWLQGLARPIGQTRWLLDPGAARPLAAAMTSLRGAARIVVLSGPEGGLSPAERALARDAGFESIALGTRVLRADTAPLAALACLATLGD